MLPARELGMQHALDHADRVHERWSEDAYNWLIDYARTHEMFSGEDVSDAHIAAHMPQPPDLRAWGPLYRRAVREGHIIHFDNNGRSRRRASPCPRYWSMVFREAA